ncbi:GHKL domain-containing protein [Spirosoma sp. HMF4905]|uniref:histidine kinase n=1 Tax=Spirosoma arboris TaxID=2682092 RepID=A0A7K1SIR8_9BACT|nr:HAMP domain-containing sensor histidine kinase [Spirosoma arboris]MVM33665.1 GHKL domain-containing protein [Spirosoma arboris]
MKRTSLRGLMVLATGLVIGILLTQVLFLKKAADFEERLTDQTIKTALIRVRRLVMNTALPQNAGDSTGIRQLSPPYFVVNIDRQVDEAFLKQQLEQELYRVQITDDFQFAIFDKVNQKLVFGEYVARDKPARKALPVKGLPTYASNDYYFCVYFPFKNHIILRELNVWILFSLLVGLAVIVFGYAIFIILRQRQLAEIQTDFINSMTHEFQTPIATISISAEALKTKGMVVSPERIDHYASIIHQESKRLANQVETILQVARTDQQHLHLIRQSVHLQDCLLAIMQKVQLNTKTDPAALTLRVPTEPIYLSVDPIHFSNAIYNVLDNAIKYSTEIIDVVMTVQPDESWVIIAITDKGVGISKKNAKRIFKKFYRIPTQGPDARTGFGIGLHYVQQIVKAHNGSIFVESKLGEGTTFSIRIPK